MHVLKLEYIDDFINARCECGLEFLPYKPHEGVHKEQWYESIVDIHRKHVRSVHGLDTIIHDNDRFLKNYNIEGLTVLDGYE